MNRRRKTILFAGLATLCLVALAILLARLDRERGARLPTPGLVETVSPAASAGSNAWLTLQQQTPVAYATPLAEPVPSPIDGTYSRITSSWPQWWTCLRCADYRLSGGIWRLQFDRGVMRILYDVTGWHSLASFKVSGNRIQLFNDPYCPDEAGEYTWKLADGQLQLQSVEDTCSFQLRGANLSSQPWSACPEPGGEKTQDALPPGCEINPEPQIEITPERLPLTVRVFPGDSRFFEKTPDVTAYANSADTHPPQGIEVAFHADSIPYGLSRILWWQGDWIEATSDPLYQAIGVQFFGGPQTGWARVLFDGKEVWQGNTAAIWSKNGRHGGYIEVSGFEPGRHILRVESMNFDYHPVSVASFGFSTDSGVSTGQR